MKFLEYLDKRKWRVEKRIKTRKYYIELPKIFSLTENTDESIRILKHLLSYKDFVKKPLFINWSTCKKMDLGASTVLTLIILNIVVYCLKNKINPRFEGKYPNKSEINNLLLKNSFFKYITPDFENINKDENILQLIAGGKSELEFRHLVGIDKIINFDYFFDCCGNVTNFLKNCVKSTGNTLTKTGENEVCSLVGEILTNLKEHLGERFSQYFIIGFFEEKDNLAIINLTFLNFGDTFYEGLKENSTSDMLQVLNKLSEEYIRINKGFSENFTEEMFWTQLALQNSISRKYIKNDGKNRGTGTISMLDFFFNLDKEKSFIPKLTLISGNTKIRFDINDKKYYNDNMLIFNEEKNIFTKQNSNNILKILEFFPGTIITLDIILKDIWLKKEI